MSQTKKLSSKGWAKQAPGTRERKIMRKKCGSKCFLGPEISFPICPKGTCKINSKGIYAAYVRARQYGSKRSSKRSSTKRSSKRTKRHTKKLYQSIATKAKTMLKKQGFNLK
jgi:hypothetical protein